MVWDKWVLAKQKVEEVMYKGYLRRREVVYKGVEATTGKAYLETF